MVAGDIIGYAMGKNVRGVGLDHFFHGIRIVFQQPPTMHVHFIRPLHCFMFGVCSVFFKIMAEIKGNFQ